MADIDLDTLSFKELKQLEKDVGKAIASFEQRQKAEALAKVEALTKELGFSLAELVGTAVKTTRGTAAAKYRHPENATLTWSGRGRRPQWFTDALAAGAKAEDLAIG